jgi:hypothetical protein
MTVIIDDSDRELFLLAKQIEDSDYENCDVETTVLINMLKEKGREIELLVDEESESVFIKFPKKKRFGLF